MVSDIKEGNHVLVLWGSASQPEKLQKTVLELQSITGSSGKVSLENVERLSLAAYSASSFDVILSGVIFPQSIIHSLDLLGEIVKLVKPHGTVILQEGIVSESNGSVLKTKEKLISTLKISGLTNISEVKEVLLDTTETSTLRELLNANGNISVVEIRCEKPNFEVGSSSKLSFAVKATSKPSAQIAAVWKLDDTVDDDIETIDADDLLEEEDLKKPDPSSLRVCGTTGKRKACKNCSCGLAEELSAESSASKESQTKTSACGNCYLGDAFRCASCPYLGMPAFKPGEKIELSERQLKADV